MDIDINIYHKTVEKIFDYIKSQDWKSLLLLIKDTKINLNIKDNSDTYLIEYAIIFNKIDLIKILLDKEIKIDMIGDDNRSILYNVIKFSYIDILSLLLKKNNNLIGDSILNIKDNDGNTAIFYAIRFSNIECVKEIFNYMTNFSIKNNIGDTILHYSIRYLNLEIFKYINLKIEDLNIQNNDGHTILHLIIKYNCSELLKYILLKYANNLSSINFNSVDFKYNLSILHYLCISLNYELLIILDDKIKLFNGNIQDNNGNIFYHYFINNISKLKDITKSEILKIIQINQILKNNIKFDFNLYNINGDTIGHILAYNIDFFINNQMNLIINWVLENSNLNIQNNDGISILFILVKNNYWEKYSNILINKKLDIFITTNSNDNMLNYIKIDKIDNFINIITESYLNQLTSIDKKNKWLDYWDNRCQTNINLSELNQTELDLIKDFNIDKIEIKSNICYEIFFNKIKKFIDNFISDKNSINLYSHPRTYKPVILIKEYPNVSISTFTGSTIDILCSLFFLSKKFNDKIENIIDTSLSLILNKNVIECKQSNNIKKCEVVGIEILWKNFQLIIPENIQLYKQITQLIHNFNKTSSVRFFILPLSIELNIDEMVANHSNILIFDFITMEVERFEPHGSYPPDGMDYNIELLDILLENKINSFNLSLTYISPLKYENKIGFQIKEINELKNDYIGDPNGFCVLWCIWWADIRIANPNILREKLFNKLNKELINNKLSHRQIIRNYSYYIIQIRDKYFENANTNINEWINDTLSNNSIKLLNNNIINDINNIQ